MATTAKMESATPNFDEIGAGCWYQVSAYFKADETLRVPDAETICKKLTEALTEEATVFWRGTAIRRMT